MTRFVTLVLVLLGLVIAGCHPAPPVDPHAITAEGSLSNRFVRSDRATPVAARLVITAAAVERAVRPPVNLALVVDTSGSMEGRAIEDARAASKALLAALRPGDRIAVVSFGSTTELLLPSTPIEDADQAKLRRSIDEMKALGTTDMAGGLRAGMAEVSAHLVPDGVNRIILLGDGDPNEAAPVKQMSSDAGAGGISITALGLGPDYNETLMGEVAQLSGGRFHYVADSTKVAGFFDAEIVRLNRIYAKNAVVFLTPGPGVTLGRVIGQRDARAITIGDLSFGEQRELVVELEAPARRAGASVEILDAVLRFQDARSGATIERRLFFGAHATAKDEEVRAGRDANVEQAASRAAAAAATLEAIEAARRGDMEKAEKAQQSAPSAKKPITYDFEDTPLNGDLVKALPSVAPSSARKPSAVRDSVIVRQAHDQAMKVLMTH
jgi:Ca-activated chloride channel family protein